MDHGGFKPYCQGCRKTWPGQRLFRCSTCLVTLCLMCQCQATPEVQLLCTCFTHPHNSGVAPWSHNEIRVSALSQPVPKPFTRLRDGFWLHDRPELDVYKVLIDSFRLRIHDEYLLDGVSGSGTVYGGAMDSHADFVKYLDAAEQRAYIMPSWWTALKRKECDDLSMKQLQFHDLRVRLTQAMVVEYYGDSSMPAQLRVFAQAVRIRTFQGGDNPRNILPTMVTEEATHGGVTRIDWFSWNCSFTENRWGAIC